MNDIKFKTRIIDLLWLHNIYGQFTSYIKRKNMKEKKIYIEIVILKIKYKIKN